MTGGLSQLLQTALGSGEGAMVSAWGIERMSEEGTRQAGSMMNEKKKA